MPNFDFVAAVDKIGEIIEPQRNKIQLLVSLSVLLILSNICEIVSRTEMCTYLFKNCNVVLSQHLREGDSLCLLLKL